MWQQWWRFYVTVVGLLVGMCLLSQSNWAADGLNSLAIWLAERLF